MIAADTLKILFPLVYGGGNKQSKVAKQIYEKVKNYISDQSFAGDCIYTQKKDRQKLKLRFAQTQIKGLKTGIYVKFMVEYGCALLIFKQKLQSSISVQIVVPEQWRTSSNTSKAQRLEFCQPKAQSSIYTPQLAQYQSVLETFVLSFNIRLQKAIEQVRTEYQEQKKAEKYTPQQIQKAVKITLNDKDYKSYYRLGMQVQPNPQQEQNKVKVQTISSQNIQYSNSNADLSWYVVQAVLRKLIVDKKKPQETRYKCDKLIIGFKSLFLLNTVKQNKLKNERYRTQIVNFKKCLDQIIFSYRSTVSLYTKKHQKFFEIIKKIQELIIQINGGRLSSKIEDKYQIQDQILIDQVVIPRINKPDKIVHQPQMIQKARILQLSYKVKKRVPFESLLEMYVKTTQKPSWKNQKAQQKLIFQNHWVLLCEKTLFQIANQIKSKDQIDPIIDLSIHMRQIECQIGASNVCKLAILYQKIVGDPKCIKHYGMGLEGQSASHIELVKTICAVISFESVKMNRQRKKSNLSKYRVPIDIEKLYKNFISHDYQARMAMKNIYEYHQNRKHLKPIFQLDGSCQSFKQFGQLVGQQTRSAHVWISCMQQILKLQKQKIIQNIRYQQASQRLKTLQFYKNRIKSYGQRYDSDLWKNQRINAKVTLPLCQFQQNQKFLYSFVHNIPADVLGLLKIVFIAQNPKKSSNKIMDDNQFQIINSNVTLNSQYLPLKIHNKKPRNYQYKSINSQNLSIDIIGRTQPTNNIKLVFNQCQSAYGIRENNFKIYDIEEDKQIQVQKKLMCQRSNYESLKKFLGSPSDKDLQRQHKAYANQYLRPKSIQIQQFLSLCTTRSAEQIQIIALCSNILQRQVIANCYDIGHKFRQQVFLQTAGQLCSYNYKVQKYFGMIQKLVRQFTDVWVYSDVNFAPILGPFIGFLIRQLKDNGLGQQKCRQLKKVPLKLAKKCWDQFQRGQKQFEQNPQLRIQWDQRFIVTAAICCFRQIQLTLEDVEEILFLTKLILQLRSCKIFSDRQQRPKNKRQFQVQRSYSIQKAIFNNIQVISDFLIVNTHLLGEVLKQIDQGFPTQIEWERVQIYQFIGRSQQSQDFYQIDLFRGRLFKNGKQLSALDQKIKESQNFKKIFQKRQFQVYPSNQPHFVRTKNDFNYQFKTDRKQNQIFFEFSEDGSRIRYICRKPHEEGQKVKQQIWQLIPQQKLQKSFVHIPKLYLKYYFAWLCQQNKCMVFRKRKYEQLYDIGLVVHLKTFNNKQFQIAKAYHVVFHGSFQNQNLQRICSIDNGYFDEMILRSKQKELIALKPYKYISRIEDPSYVFELKNQKTKQTQFWLHRYQLKFKLKENLLISESHYGYSIDASYYQIKECIFNKFPCLVLKKDMKNEAIMNNHKRIMIVSDGKIFSDGEIQKQSQANIHIDSFKYDIHDCFGDIRGLTRQSQLFLAALMLSIDDNMRMKWIQMTPFQYSMHILKTCFTNRPLNAKQSQKLLNLIELADFNSNDEMLLLCQVLWKGTEKVSKILSFTQKNDKVSYQIRRLQKQLLQCRTLYQKKLYNQTIAHRKKILESMLRFIGFIVIRSQAQIAQKDSSSSSSSQEFEYKQYWKNIKQYKGEHILEDFEKLQAAYNNIRANAKKIDYWNKEYPQIKQQNNNFPVEIQKNAISANKNLMMKQMMEELKSSYECFIKQQKRLYKIIQEFSSKNRQKNVQIIQKLSVESKNCLRQIQLLLKKVKQQNQNHPDIISGLRPTLSESFYTRTLCFEDEIYAYYPKILPKASQKLKKALKMWMDLQTRIASFERIKILLRNEKLDIVALLRQLGSPRQQIFKNTSWICFQTEMKIQIWPSQLQTYHNLMENRRQGPFCQLNMGEGKTQVIIPMMILNTIFANKNYLPRVNLLTSLYEQARGNMFKFLSVTGFQIPGFEIPFNRKVVLNKHNIYAIRDLISCFSSKVYVLVNRQSRLSEILKYSQIALSDQSQQPEISLQKMPLLDCKIFDIFDEIDAMMTAKKSYIFSIGDKIGLPSANIRLQILKQLIQVFLKQIKQLFNSKMLTSDQTEEDAIEAIRKGQYPAGLRLTLQNVSDSKIIQWKKQMAEKILKDPERHQYSFIKTLNQKQLKNLIDYCVNPLTKSAVISQNIPQSSRQQIYILRGALAYGIFEHCLSKRCGVDYGVPGPQHAKKIAVPYEAADIPSKTSEYEHPEVSALLSYIAYNTRGLNLQQFQTCINALVKLTPTSMENQYKKWVQILSLQDKANLTINQAKQINIISKSEQLKLYQIYHKNRKTVAFWLNRCVFPKDLVQYKQNICSSSFDLAHVQESVGFSGTMDNHWILPNKIKFTPCQTPSIKGTDGKMVYLTTKFTKQISLIQQNQKPLWQRLIDLALSKGVGCLIDVGAMCVGKSLKKEIVPWIAEHEHFNSEKYCGISFCDENGKWQVYDVTSKFYISRGTTIPDHQTFVVFDEARTRGADLKMNNDVIAAMSLGPGLTKDKFMQAAGRLRKLGRNQSIIILATHQVFSQLPTFPKQFDKINEKLKKIETIELVKLILAWCCHNTIHENQNLLAQYANLGWKYVHSKIYKKPYRQKIHSQLKEKYQSTLQTTTVATMGLALSKSKEKQQQNHFTGKHLRQLLQKYGKYVQKRAGTLDDVCQRQVETEKQIQKQQQNQLIQLKAIPQKQIDPNLLTKIQNTPFVFDKNFKMSQNFIKTTTSKGRQKLLIQENQLPKTYFVKYNDKQFILISLRQASLFIKQNILKINKQNTYKIALLDNLTIEVQQIVKNKHQAALVEAKFISGHENYNLNQQEYLSKFFLRSLKTKNKSQQDRRKDHEDIVSIILRRRRIHHKKLAGSTLEKMITKLSNEDLPDYKKQEMKVQHAEQIFNLKQ